MDKETFDLILMKDINKKQHEVLDEILAGKTVGEIAKDWKAKGKKGATPCNISYHLSNICKKFGLKNAPGEGFTHRWELLDLFLQYRPELLSASVDFSQLKHELECPNGQVPLDSKVYVERYLTSSLGGKLSQGDLVKILMNPGAMLRVKGPKSTGKSSLIVRILLQLKSSDADVVTFQWGRKRESFFGDLEKLLQNFCREITNQLDLPDKLKEHWDSELLEADENCTGYLANYILPHVKQDLILGLDDLDRIFPHEEVAQDFLRLLRAWHEQAKTSPLWQKLRLFIAHSTEPYVKLPINESPFNVGIFGELSEFDMPQVKELAKKHGLLNHSSNAQHQLNTLYQLVGGHPYLIRLALYQLSKDAASFNRSLEAGFVAQGIYAPHLSRHWGVLSQEVDLAASMKQVVISEQPVVALNPGHQFKLYSMGLIRYCASNGVIPRCQLYRSYFQQMLQAQ